MVNGRIAGAPALQKQTGRRADDPATPARHADLILVPPALIIHIEQKRHSFAPPGGLRNRRKVSRVL